MKDVQSTEPKVRIEVTKTGISNIHYPVRVLKKDGSYETTIATISLSVCLPENQRGTHMSRLVELLEQNKHDVNRLSLSNLLKQMQSKLNVNNSYIEIRFPYYLSKEAPVTKKESLMVYEAGFKMSLVDGTEESFIVVKAPITVVCPCSKEISDRGAHNQRAYITVEVEPKEFIWFEDVVNVIESSGSSPVYSLLKREDEKYVTEHAYDNPKFVEDVVREVYDKLTKRFNVGRLTVKAESEESIHNHLAFAEVRNW